MRIFLRSVAAIATAFLAAGAVASPVEAQTPLPAYDPSTIAALAFRPGANDALMLATTNKDGRLQVHLVRLVADGKPVLTRTLPGAFSAAAWLDESRVVTGGSDGKLESWPLAGDGATLLTTLPEPIVGLGVSPFTRTLVVRLPETMRLYSGDGRPAGPTVTLGRAAKPSDVCPPDGIELTPAFSSDERLAAFSGLCGDLRVMGRDGTRLVHADLARGNVRRHAFSSDGKTLVVSYGGNGGADAWPVAPGRLGNPHPFPGPGADGDVADIASLPGTPGFVVLSGDHVRFLGSDGAPLHDDATLSRPTRVAVSSDGSRIAVAAAEGLVLFDGKGERLAARAFANFGRPLAVAPAKHGAEILALYRDGKLRLWRLDGTEARPPIEAWSATSQNVSARKVRLLVSPGGRLTGVLAPDGVFELFDENWKSVGRPIRFPPDADGAALRATLLLDDRILRPMPDGSGFLAMSFDGRVLGKLPYGDQQKLTAEAATTTTGLIAVYGADGRLVLSSPEGKPVNERRIDIPNVAEPRLEISADGKVVVLHDAPARVPPHLLVWHTDKETPEFRDGRFGALAADGSLLRLVNGRLVVDAPDGTARPLPPIEADSVEAVTPDAKLALVSKGGITRPIKLAP